VLVVVLVGTANPDASWSTPEHSKISTGKDENTNPNGPCGWPHATAKPYSSAAPATKTSTTRDARHGSHDTPSTGGPDAVNIARPVRRGPVEKDLDAGTSSAVYPTVRVVRMRGDPPKHTPAHHNPTGTKPVGRSPHAITDRP